MEDIRPLLTDLRWAAQNLLHQARRLEIHLDSTPSLEEGKPGSSTWMAGWNAGYQAGREPGGKEAVELAEKSLEDEPAASSPIPPDQKSDWVRWVERQLVDIETGLRLRQVELEGRMRRLEQAGSGSQPTTDSPMPDSSWDVVAPTGRTILPSSPSGPLTTPTFRVEPTCWCAHKQAPNLYKPPSANLWQLRCGTCDALLALVGIHAPAAPPI